MRREVGEREGEEQRRMKERTGKLGRHFVLLGELLSLVVSEGVKDMIGPSHDVDVALQVSAVGCPSAQKRRSAVSGGVAKTKKRTETRAQNAL